MSVTERRPPLALRLAVTLLPEHPRGEVLGDLVEHWHSEVRARSWPSRMLWAWRQPFVALSSRYRYGRRVPGGPAGNVLGSAPSARGRALSPGFSWIDVKLAGRMLFKHPGITLVAVFALGIGIPASLVPHHLIDSVFDESPPFDEGHRVVGLVMFDQETGAQAPPRLGDYELWADRLDSFGTIAAVVPQQVNVIADDGSAEGTRGAAMTASAFAIARVPPLLGRVLQESDEGEGGPEVAVIGYDFWQARLAGNPEVIGSTLRIGGVPTTVVGVMPEGFAMPILEHIWLPLRKRAIQYPDGLGPAVQVYGRLADGVSESEARAALSAVGARAPTREDDERIVSPAVVAYSAVLTGTPTGFVVALLAIGQAIQLVLLLISCGNVAILLLARAANRTGEIAVRTALGASRARVVGQLFIEALVLALLATGVGLFVLNLVLGRLEARFDLPFWQQLGVSPELALKALGLAVASAVVAGVLPALRATGTTVQNPLQRLATGASGFRFGRVTGAMIVLLIGLGVGSLFAGGMTYQMFRPLSGEGTRAADAGRFLIATVTIPQSTLTPDEAAERARAHVARIASAQRALEAKLAAEPGVRGVAFADVPPGEGQFERAVRMQGDGRPAEYRGLPGVVSYVSPQFFQVLDVKPMAGRTLEPDDMPLSQAVPATAVVVNHKFVERRELEPAIAVGRNIRFNNGPDQPPGPWMEIVGVVPDIEASAGRQLFDGTPMIYMSAAPGAVHPLSVVVDTGEDPVGFAPRLRALVAEADPTAILTGAMALEDLPFGEMTAMRVVSGILIGVSVISILLSSAALYALMSFTVVQRTREIGIRTALGGRASSIVRTVAQRALRQLALGVALGAGFWFLAFTGLMATASLGPDMQRATASWPVVLALATAVVIVIGLGSCLGPTLRGLRVRPIDALRADG